MMRGNNKATIFSDDQDRTKFLQRLGENITEARHPGDVVAPVAYRVLKLL
jgi:hypothetical protein